MDFPQFYCAGPSQWFSEFVAAFGLVLTILLTLRANAAAVAGSVALYITAAYWFTASTSFANPAVTIARCLSEAFAGTRPTASPAFCWRNCSAQSQSRFSSTGFSRKHQSCDRVLPRHCLWCYPHRSPWGRILILRRPVTPSRLARGCYSSTICAGC